MMRPHPKATALIVFSMLVFALAPTGVEGTAVRPAQAHNLTLGGTLTGSPGDTVVITVGISDGAGVGEVQADIHYDPAVLTYVSGEPGSAVAGFALKGVSNNAPGLIRVLATGLGMATMPAGPGVVATITFTVNAAAAGGPSALTFTGLAPASITATDSAFTVAGGAPPTATPAETPTATPTLVPVPPTFTPTPSFTSTPVTTVTPVPSTPTPTPTATPTAVVPTPTLAPPTATPMPGEGLVVPFSTEGQISLGISGPIEVAVPFVYQQGGELTVSVGDFGGALDPAAALTLPDGRTISDDDGGLGDDAMIVFTRDNPALAGKYKLIVKGQGGTVGRFSVSALPAAVPQAAQTGVIGFGQKVEGTIRDFVEVHIYRFYAEVGDYIDIYLGDMDSALNPFLTLSGPEGFEAKTDDDSGPDDDAEIAGFPAPVAGLYTITVGGAPGTTGTGPYVLVLAARSDKPIDRGTINPGDRVAGNIGQAGQVYEYAFTNPTGAAVTFELEDPAPETLDPYLNLLTGGQIAATDDNSGPDDAAYIVSSVAEGVIQVSGGPRKTTGPYLLLYKVGGYTPPEIQFGENVTYVFPGDVERYRFTAAAGQTVIITVGDFGGPLDPAVRLIGPDGSLVAESLNAFPAPEDDAQIPLQVLRMTGVYTVEVYGQPARDGRRTFGRALIVFRLL